MSLSANTPEFSMASMPFVKKAWKMSASELILVKASIARAAMATAAKSALADDIDEPGSVVKPTSLRPPIRSLIAMTTSQMITTASPIVYAVVPYTHVAINGNNLNNRLNLLPYTITINAGLIVIDEHITMDIYFVYQLKGVPTYKHIKSRGQRSLERGNAIIDCKNAEIIQINNELPQYITDIKAPSTTYDFSDESLNPLSYRGYSVDGATTNPTINITNSMVDQIITATHIQALSDLNVYTVSFNINEYIVYCRMSQKNGLIYRISVSICNKRDELNVEGRISYAVHKFKVRVHKIHTPKSSYTKPPHNMYYVVFNNIPFITNIITECVNNTCILANSGNY